MTDQSFNGPVSQVAGGDIHNYGPKEKKPKTWADLPREEQVRLFNEKLRVYKWLKWRRWLCLPFAMSLLAAACAIGSIFVGLPGYANPIDTHNWRNYVPIGCGVVWLLTFLWLAHYQRRVNAWRAELADDLNDLHKLIRRRVD